MNTLEDHFNTIAILPMKAPGTGKTRLESSLTDAQRKMLANAMFSDVLTALSRCHSLAGVVVVTNDLETAQAAAAYGAKWIDDEGADGHSLAAQVGIEHALSEGAERVLLVPGDCPAMSPQEIDHLLESTPRNIGLCVIPDRHGSGTNGLLISPPKAVPPSFGPGSHARHHELAAAAGVVAVTAELNSFALDVDTPEDLEAVIAHLESAHGGAGHTRGILAQMSDLTNV